MKMNIQLAIPLLLSSLIVIPVATAEGSSVVSDPGLTTAVNTLNTTSSTGSTSIKASIDNLISGYGSGMTKPGAPNSLFAQSPSVGFTTVYGPGQALLTNSNSTIRIALPPDSSGVIQPNTAGPDLGQQALQTILTASSSTTPNLQTTLNNALCGQTGSSVGAWLGSLINPNSAGTNNCSYVDTSATSANFDARSLLGPLGYATGTDAQTAFNYIQFVAPSLSQPFGADISALNDYKSANFPAYVMAVRSYAAAQSAAISTLYKSYADRVRIAGLGGQTGISADTNAPASVLEVEDYGAKKRVTSKDWYTAMENATPATVEREILYVLAEMRLEQYKTRQALERLNFTTALLLMQASTWTSATFNLPQAKSSVTPPPR